jgi:hypothetical protein
MQMQDATSWKHGLGVLVIYVTGYYDTDMDTRYSDTPFFKKIPIWRYMDIYVIFIFIEIYSRDKIKMHT